jgi:PKD repeat protein
MFRKIVSQLSLSPSAASQLTFYARRLGQERVTRTFSALAAVLIVGLQFAVLAAPPAPANAASPNDIILGGIVSKDDLLNRYDASTNLQALYHYMGISRQDIVNTKKKQIVSKDHSLSSLGRIQHASTDKKLAVDKQVFWGRHLYEFDTGNNVRTGSYYNVLEGTRASDGGYFAVMFDCGNIVYKSIPPQPTPTPKPPTPIPTPPPTPKPATPTVACSYLQGNPTSGEQPLKVAFTGAGSANGQTITDYIFDFGDKTSATQKTPTVTHTYATAGKFTATLSVKGSAGKPPVSAPTCALTINSTPPPAAFAKSKTAVNLTQNIDATTKPAQAGELIKYHLTTKNTGGIASPYVVVEHIEDILEYADLTNPEGASFADGILTWPSTNIAPGTVLSMSFTVKIKSPVPATPVGLSDPLSYDLRLDNVYGNTVQIMLTPPFGKQVESASTSLPATGPGTATFIIIFVSAITLFYYFRNRQLINEVRLLRGEYQGGI